jgi:hypothetical protein
MLERTYTVLIPYCSSGRGPSGVLVGHSIARVNTEWRSNCNKLEQVNSAYVRGSEDIKAYPPIQTAATWISQNLIWI